MGKEHSIAMEIAARSFSSSLLKISLRAIDSTDKAEDLIDSWGANAIITTKPWPEIIQLLKIANNRSVPLYSLATPQSFTYFTHNPYFFQLPSTLSLEYIKCMTQLIKHYNFRQVIVVYEDDEYGSISSSIILLLDNAFRAIGSKICKYVPFPLLDSVSNPNEIIHENLEIMKSQLCTVYIIVKWSSSFHAMNLFQEANALGMMDKGSVWIVGDDITTHLHSTFTPLFVETHLQGLVGIKTYVDESSSLYNDFSIKYRNVSHHEPGINALEAYDAVHVAAQSYATLHNMDFTKLTSLTGRFQLKRGVSEATLAIYQIINVVGRSYKVVGQWSTKSGFTATNLGYVYWPGMPDKIPGGWRKLKIGFPAISMLITVAPHANGISVSGFPIDVFDMGRELLGYYLPYELFEYNGSYSHLVAQVPDVYDAVVGGITVLSKRTVNATFTQPYLPSELARIVRIKPDRTPWMLTKPFTRTVWWLIAIAVAYNCFCIWYLEHTMNPDFHGPWWNQVGAALYYIFCSMFYSSGNLRSYYTKIVVVVWFFVVLILSSSFTASLASILTSKVYEPVVLQGKVGCANESFVGDYLQQALGIKSSQIVKFDNIDEYPAAFENGIITSAYLQNPSMKVFLSKYDGYTTYGETYNFGGLGFVFPKGSPLADDFSRAILSLLEHGEIKRLEEKYFSMTFTTCPISDLNRNSNTLGIECFWFLFIMTGTASTLVMFAFKARLLPDYRRKSSRLMSSWRSKYYVRSFRMSHTTRRNSKI